MALAVRSISCSSDPSRWPSLPVTTSRWRQVTGSMLRRRPRTGTPALHVRRGPPSACRAGGAAGRRRRAWRRRGPARPNPSRLWTRSCSRSARSAARTSNSGLVRLGHRAAQRAISGNVPASDRAARHQHFARPQHAQLVGQRLQAAGACVLGGAELAGGQVEEGHAEDVDRRAAPGSRTRHDGHQERRLARVQIRAVGERAGRHHADDLALDEPLGLLRVLHLLADGHAKPLLTSFAM